MQYKKNTCVQKWELLPFAYPLPIYEVLPLYSLYSIARNKENSGELQENTGENSTIYLQTCDTAVGHSL